MWKMTNLSAKTRNVVYKIKTYAFILFTERQEN